MKQNTKAEKVLDVAFTLLKTQGDHGVTMRQVASCAGMSLSNVQYYYKNKNALLKALADRYFSACLDELRSQDPIQPGDDFEQNLETLLALYLHHGIELSEMCCIFREYWAISTRNAEIDDHIRRYYEEMVVILSDKLRPIATSEAGLADAISVFIPYVEGYSITARAMPVDIERVTKNLKSIVSGLLRQ